MQADTGLSAISGIVTIIVATTLVSDTFTGTDGTNLTAHTADVNQGTGWIANTGTITLLSNQAHCTSGFPYYSIDAGQASVTLTADITLSGTAACGLSGRVSDALNTWDIDISTSAGTMTLTIYEQVAGVFTARAQVSFPDPGGPYGLKAVFSGTNVIAAVGNNETSYGSATSNQTITKHGINLGPGWSADNFKITNP